MAIQKLWVKRTVGSWGPMAISIVLIQGIYQMHVLKRIRTYPRHQNPILTKIRHCIEQRVRSRARGSIVGIYRVI